MAGFLHAKRVVVDGLACCCGTANLDIRSFCLNFEVNEMFIRDRDTLRLSLEETVHKENIKCFRNIQGALEEQGDGRSYDLNALRKYLRVIVWFQLITIVPVSYTHLDVYKRQGNSCAARARARITRAFTRHPLI